MGGACGTFGYRRDTGFWWGHPMEGDIMQYVGADGRIILKYFLDK
jgi:hypothetical protein